jgi:hypothetical protein
MELTWFFLPLHRWNTDQSSKTSLRKHGMCNDIIMVSYLIFCILTLSIKDTITKSQIFALIVLAWRFFLEKDASNYFELSLSSWSIRSADLDLTLKRAILPVIELILIVSRHLQPFLSIFVDELKVIPSKEGLSYRFVFTLKDPVVVFIV